MGYIRHHAVLVTSWDEKALTDAHEFATELLAEFPEVCESVISPIASRATNAVRSFAVFPDGSKEGWSTSGQGDGFRAHLVGYLDARRHEDGSSNLDWCLVQYGDDEGDNRMLRHDADRRGPS